MFFYIIIWYGFIIIPLIFGILNFVFSSTSQENENEIESEAQMKCFERTYCMRTMRVLKIVIVQFYLWTRKKREEMQND